jgi:hypothetical protein
MCTQANRASVPDSFHALTAAVVALASASVALAVAAATIPWRSVRSRPSALLDRVEVIPSAPPLGKADMFDQWFDGSSGEGKVRGRRTSGSCPTAGPQSAPALTSAPCSTALS